VSKESGIYTDEFPPVDQRAWIDQFDYQAGTWPTKPDSNLLVPIHELNQYKDQWPADWVDDGTGYPVLTKNGIPMDIPRDPSECAYDTGRGIVYYTDTDRPLPKYPKGGKKRRR
jgi:hypothetical protein